MSEFVEQCLREWRRLGVADPLAEEMAADLASDLAEAEIEGVSAADYLGSSSDPRSFAAAWASERGIVPVPPSQDGGRRGPLALVAFTSLTAIMVIVAALLLATGEPKLILARTTPPPGARRTVLRTSAAAPIEWILLFVAIAALGFSAWLWLHWRRSRPPIASPGSGPQS
jgi:hypothetical protein